MLFEEVVLNKFDESDRVAPDPRDNRFQDFGLGLNYEYI